MIISSIVLLLFEWSHSNKYDYETERWQFSTGFVISRETKLHFKLPIFHFTKSKRRQGNCYVRTIFRLVRRKCVMVSFKIKMKVEFKMRNEKYPSNFIQSRYYIYILVKENVAVSKLSGRMESDL